MIFSACCCLLIECFCGEVTLFTFFRFAYIEFADKESVRTAMALDESLFRGRQIKVRDFFIVLFCFRVEPDLSHWSEQKESDTTLRGIKDKGNVMFFIIID